MAPSPAKTTAPGPEPGAGSADDGTPLLNRIALAVGATVLASSAAEADALATAVSVLGADAGLSLLARDNMDPQLSLALAQAYNNWMHEFCQYSPDQLKFAALVNHTGTTSIQDLYTTSADSTLFFGSLHEIALGKRILCLLEQHEGVIGATFVIFRNRLCRNCSISLTCCLVRGICTRCGMDLVETIVAVPTPTYDRRNSQYPSNDQVGAIFVPP